VKDACARLNDRFRIPEQKPAVAAATAAREPEADVDPIVETLTRRCSARYITLIRHDIDLGDVALPTKRVFDLSFKHRQGKRKIGFAQLSANSTQIVVFRLDAHQPVVSIDLLGAKGKSS
jgi:hypothetical protein